MGAGTERGVAVDVEEGEVNVRMDGSDGRGEVADDTEAAVGGGGGGGIWRASAPS